MSGKFQIIRRNCFDLRNEAYVQLMHHMRNRIYSTSCVIYDLLFLTQFVGQLYRNCCISFLISKDTNYKELSNYAELATEMVDDFAVLENWPRDVDIYAIIKNCSL